MAPLSERARQGLLRLKIIDADAIRVGPDEVLIVRLHEDDGLEPEAVADALSMIGLTGRSLVIKGNVELAVVPRSEDTGG